MAIYRLESGERRMATKERGAFVLGDPRHGRRKHLAVHKVFVVDEDEAARLIRNEGFSVWVEPLSTKPHRRSGLVRAGLYRDSVSLT
ncbi:MAG: hypothetical protein ACRCS0_08285 [Albidovulum sp.]